MEAYPELLHSRFNKDFVSEGVKLVLTNNYFLFNNTTYLQTKGTAMGTKMAPTYANLTMAFLEKKLYNLSTTANIYQDKTYIENNWKRYLDDCFILWTESKEKLEIFTDILQNLHEMIKFTIQSDLNKIPFLDIMIIKNESNITTDIYHKPTDTFNYVPFYSCHPKHTKQNIPYNLARRICTIISKKDLRNTRLAELRTRLKEKSYPQSLIEHGIKKALTIPINELREPKKQLNNSKIILPLVTTYNPNNHNTFPEIKARYELFTGARMKKLKDETTLINSKRQANNLKRILTRAAFTENKPETGTKKCGSSKCGTCKYMLEAKEIFFQEQPLKPFIIKSSMNCCAKDVIYVIICGGCSKEYIGQTSSLRERVTVHKQQIRDSILRRLKISKHIAECTSAENPDFYICPILSKTDKTVRILTESQLIDKYKPKLNSTN